jgi:hypothetical protein
VAPERHGLERPRLLHRARLQAPARRRPADRPALLRGRTQARAARGPPAPPAGEHRPGGLCPGGHRPRDGDLLQIQPDPGGERPADERAYGPCPYQPDLDEVLSEQEDEFDPDTRWAIAWYEQHGFEEGEFGNAELLSKAKVRSVSGLAQAGIVHSRGGKVRLLRPDELPDDWDPARDRRFTVWEATHHLVKIYWCQQKGDRATADLLRRLGSDADYARDLAYRLFSIAEKKRRSAEAQAYNALVLGWSELAKLAQEQHENPELF